MPEIYDMAIIGSGCSGLAGAMYAGRMGMKTLVLGEMRGGTITTTDIVENYPGFKSIGGYELAKKLEEHAMEYKNVEIKDTRVTRIERKNGEAGFFVESGPGKFEAKSVLFSTGTEWRKLGVPGEKEFANKGVHYCALCDGGFYKGKKVAVIGGSDSAAKDALVLANLASEVYIVYRKDQIRAEPVNYERVMNNSKIKIINNTNVVEIVGEKKVTGVKFDKEHAGSFDFSLDAVFVAVGHVPLSNIAKDAGVELDSKGYVKINRNSETNVPGFFAAGDVTDTRFKQAIIGVAEAVSAVYSAHEYLQGKK